MMRTALTAILLAGLLLAAAGAAAQTGGQRIALVIGNSKYVASPLTNPGNDAIDMSKALEGLGFSVTRLLDVDKEQMENAIMDFGRASRGAGAALFFYAGHGMQVGGVNYLIPVNARIDEEKYIRHRAVDANLVLTALEDTEAQVSIVILDACRDNPFARQWRSTAQGLAPMDAARGTLIAFATRPGATAADGSGRNGLYTSALLEHLATPDIPVESLFKRVRETVLAKSNNAQVPWEHSSLVGDFYLTRGPYVIRPHTDSSSQEATEPPQEYPPPSDLSLVGGETRSIEIGGGVTMDLVWIPPGDFMMGSPSNEVERTAQENLHMVILTRGFWMGKYEVTQEQWQKIMGSNPSYFVDAKNPVECISWHDSQAFVGSMNVYFSRNMAAIETLGAGEFRLPTEAEWEYACRAGTTTAFHFGETISTDQANYNGKAKYGNGRKGEYRKKTMPVGSFPPNAWGLHDMHGNVWEWCQDWMGAYPSGAVTDPIGPEPGRRGPFHRVLRGGAWPRIPGLCRSATRAPWPPENQCNYVGMRVVYGQ